MVYTYSPTYYTSLHDSITSICKTILPFSFKKKRLPAIAAAEQRLSKQQSDNLKWQQESFHQILNLMGLCKEGIINEDEVSAFRTHLLEAIIASPIDHEPSMILRDKLIFLQELLYAKCISEEEYHASKRPLLQRLAVQGAEIGARDVIVGAQTNISNEEWSVIDLTEEKCSVDLGALESKNKLKESSSTKKMKQPSFAFGFESPDNGTSDAGNNNISPRDRNVRNELFCSTENPFWNGHLNKKESESKSILMESLPEAPIMSEKQSGNEKGKKKPFQVLFQKDQKYGHCNRGNEHDPALEDKEKVKVKKAWGFDGFMKWKKNNSEDETAPLSLSEKSDDTNYTGQVITNPIRDVQETKRTTKTLHTNGANKISGGNIKEELSRIQTELRAKSPHVPLSVRDDQMKELSTHLPVDNRDLKKFFPKSRCDGHGDAVREEFNDHAGKMGNSRGTAGEKHKWTTFDDEENSHPNLFAPEDHSPYSAKQARFSSSKNVHTSFNSSSSIDKGFKYNPFFEM